MTEAQAQQVGAVAQQRQASLGGGQPLTSGSAGNFKVLGLRNASRALFAKVLHRIGSSCCHCAPHAKTSTASASCSTNLQPWARRASGRLPVCSC